MASTPVRIDRLQDPVILWDLDESEHREWLRTGCGNLAYDDYRAQFEARRLAAESAGRPCVLVRTRVAEVLSVLQEIGVVSTPAGCEAALLSIYETQQNDKP